MRAREFINNIADWTEVECYKKATKRVHRNRFSITKHRGETFIFKQCIKHCENKTPNRFFISAYNSRFSRMLHKRFVNKLLLTRKE